MLFSKVLEKLFPARREPESALEMSKEQLFTLKTPTPISAPDFSQDGEFYKCITLHGDDRYDTEVLRWKENIAEDSGPRWLRALNICRKKIGPSGRRWLNILSGVDQILKDLASNRDYWYNGDRLDIEKLAKEHYGCTVVHCDDLRIRREVLKRPECKKMFKAAKSLRKLIQGFSLLKEGLIFINDDIKEEQKPFVTAHELAHYLLLHDGLASCKTLGNSIERIECNEEADKLAAMLLMPHSYMKERMDRPDREIAEHLGVSVKAVTKRKEEVKKEMDTLCYGRYS